MNEETARNFRIRYVAKNGEQVVNVTAKDRNDAIRSVAFFTSNVLEVTDLGASNDSAPATPDHLEFRDGSEWSRLG